MRVDQVSPLAPQTQHGKFRRRQTAPVQRRIRRCQQKTVNATLYQAAHQPIHLPLPAPHLAPRINVDHTHSNTINGADS